MSCIDFLLDAKTLDGKTVEIEGRISTFGDSLSIREKDGSGNSITVNTDNVLQIAKALLEKCSSFDADCLGRCVGRRSQTPSKKSQLHR